MNNTNGKDLIQRLVRNIAFTEPLFLDLAGCVLSIRCSSALVREQLQAYCAPFVISVANRPHIFISVLEQPVPELDLPLRKRQPEPGKTGFKEGWADLEDIRVVRKLKTGMLMLFGGGENWVVGLCERFPNQVINFINNRFIEWKLNRGTLLGHAAAVMWKNRGMAIAGFSGMGKSTLALHLMHAGADFVSNDRLLIDPSGTKPAMTGVAKWPRINPGTALNNPSLTTVLTAEEKKRFGSLPAKDLWELEQKYDVMVEKCFGPGRFRLQTGLDRLCLLNWKRDAGSMQANEIDLHERPELLPALMKDTGLFYLPEAGLPQNRSLKEYQKALQGCRAMVLSGGIDFEKATMALMAWLD